MTGQKTWAVGEEVLAADFNTYVQSQVVAQFATSAARDAWASPPNGALCVTTDANIVWQRVAGVWQILGPTAWTAITLNSGWSNVGGLMPPPRVRRIGDNVQIQFSITSGTLSNMAFLPALYTPAFTQQIPAVINQLNWGVVSIVNSGGTVGAVTPATTGRWDVNAIYSVT